MEKQFVNYFGYGSNRDLAMLAAIIGRDEIEGIKGKMLGHELCIQKLNNIPDLVLPTAPVPQSPRFILQREFGDNFELYVTRPKTDGVTYGMIWQITPAEYKLMLDWEMVEFGLQDDISAVAIDERGQLINVITPGSLNPNLPVDVVITDEKYDDYIVDKQHILDVANRSREEYYQNIKK